MTTPALSVRVGRVLDHITTHPLVASLYAGDDGVSQTVNFRDMRQVRSYYNGVLAGLTMMHTVTYGQEISLPHIGRWPYRSVAAIVPVNPTYVLADSIDPMTDELT